jgi:hypothetical protein
MSKVQDSLSLKMAAGGISVTTVLVYQKTVIIFQRICLFSTRTTCSLPPILIDLIVLIILGEDYKL